MAILTVQLFGIKLFRSQLRPMNQAVHSVELGCGCGVQLSICVWGFYFNPIDFIPIHNWRAYFRVAEECFWKEQSLGHFRLVELVNLVQFDPIRCKLVQVCTTLELLCRRCSQSLAQLSTGSSSGSNLAVFQENQKRKTRGKQRQRVTGGHSLTSFVSPLRLAGCPIGQIGAALFKGLDGARRRRLQIREA